MFGHPTKIINDSHEYVTAEDFIKGVEYDYNNALQRFCKADAEIVKRVAEIGIGENAEQGISALSLFFNHSYEYYCEEWNHRDFPFDSKCNAIQQGGITIRFQ